MVFIEKTLSLECRPLDKTIVTHVRNILGENLNNRKKKDLKFCITMDPKQGWVKWQYFFGGERKRGRG